MLTKRYIFKASAVGAAARVPNPAKPGCDEHIPALAASTLPVIGGHSEGKAERYCFERTHPEKTPILSVRHAYSFTHGAIENGVPKSVACAEAEGWSFMGKVHVERLVARLETRHRPNELHPRIKPRKNEIVGLDVEGYALRVKLDESRLAKLDSFDALQKSYGAAKIPLTSHGYITTTIVDSIEWVDKPHPRVKIEGYTLQWKGFGTIYIGELLVGHGYRRLTAIRVEMDEPLRERAARKLKTAANGTGGGGGSSAAGGDVGVNGGGGN